MNFLEKLWPWIFNNSANRKANNVFSFYSFPRNLKNEVVPVLSTEGEQFYLHQLRQLLLMPRQYFTLLPHSTPHIMERTEERLTSTLYSRSIFPSWLLARGERDIMTFLTTPECLDSLLPSEQRPLKNKTSAKLLLLRHSEAAVLAKFSLGSFFSPSPLELHLHLPTDTSVNMLPQILSEYV